MVAVFARAACFNAIGQFSRAIEDYNVALLKDQSVTAASPSKLAGTPNGKSFSGNSLLSSPNASGASQRRLQRSSSFDPLRSDDSRGTERERERERGKAEWEGGQHLTHHSPRLPLTSNSAQGGGGGGQHQERRPSMTHLASPPRANATPLESEDDNSTVISGVTFMSSPTEESLGPSLWDTWAMRAVLCPRGMTVGACGARRVGVGTDAAARLL